MADAIRIWQIAEGEQLREITRGPLDLEGRLEAWVAADVSVLSDDLLVVGRQLQTDAGGYIDLLCMNRQGDLVVVELKRDKTPREVTAQALDYGAWAVRLSFVEIAQIADAYLREAGPLGAAFQRRFGEPLPESLNVRHHLLIVATSVDARSERIIRYLSETHGVSINAVTFNYFRSAGGQEFLARTHLLEPEQVEQRALEQGASKRQRNLTREELADRAEQSGSGPLYGRLAQGLHRLFWFNTTRSSAAFKGALDGGAKALFNLIPGDSSAAAGVKFQAYTNRLGRYFGVAPAEVRGALPDDAADWVYASDEGMESEWAGVEGFMREADVDRFLNWLMRQRPARRDGAIPS